MKKPKKMTPRHINVAKCLKNVPEGTRLYSTLYGYVILDCIDDSPFPITCHMEDDQEDVLLTAEGKLDANYPDDECLLFPSKENRNWLTFEAKPQFPISIEACNNVLNLSTNNANCYMDDTLIALRRLLIARNAWWNIDNNWKPDWKDHSANKWGIKICNGKLEVNTTTINQHLLCFRTKEITDKFFTTFYDLIEYCKELL